MIEPFLRVNSVSVGNSLPFLAARAEGQKGLWRWVGIEENEDATR